MIIKGLLTSYNKNLHESVEPLIDHIKTLGDSIQIATGVLSTLTMQPDKVREALALEMLATEFADYLVLKAVPFRKGHHISGQIVHLAEKSLSVDRLSFEQLQSVDGRFWQGMQECLDYDRAVELKDAKGGTSRRSVLEQVKVLRVMLGADGA